MGWGCLAVVMGLFALFSVKALFKIMAAGQTADARAAGITAPSKLALLSNNGVRQSGYLIINGEVQNMSGEKITHLMAVVTHYTNKDSIISSEDAVVEYDPLLPGQKTPFKVMTRSNPEMKKYAVSFKTMFGGEIPYDDITKK